MAGIAPITGVVLYDGTTSLGAMTLNTTTNVWSLPWTVTAGVHKFTAVASYNNSGQTITVNSPTLTAYAAALSITGTTWTPDPAIGSDIISAPLVATLSGGLDSDGSQPTYATYAWSVSSVWRYDHDGSSTPFAPSSNFTGLPWAEAASSIGTGTDDVNLSGSFREDGHYILVIRCVAIICDSSTGNVIGTISSEGPGGADAYLGGTANELPTSDSGHAMRTNATLGTDDSSDNSTDNKNAIPVVRAVYICRWRRKARQSQGAFGVPWRKDHRFR